MPSLEKATAYILESQDNKKQFQDTGWLLDSPNGDKSSLIRTIYETKQLTVLDADFGIYRFAEWLPIHRILKGSCAPVTYKSKKLAEKLGLSNLYITFSGYWPEKGATFKTCSFKETEAYSVCGRLNRDVDRVLVVASAGNTARAFAQVCSDNNIPLLLSVPEDNINALWFNEPIKDNVKLICTKSGGDYFDAIHLSNIACELNKFFPEGGAKNVARRDGMGTTVLSATHHIGRIPDYYFQAVGSGTGAIAAWEANLRLVTDGNYGNTKMKLMVSQNSPFTPIHDAWKADSRAMLALDDTIARKQIEEIDAKVLSNRKPPYSIIGGLYDAMKDVGGDVLLATNEEAKNAAILFNKLEGNDIHPAAAIATASLINTVKEGKIEKDACIMLNITGGGEERFKSENKLHYLKPSLIFGIDPNESFVKSELEKLFQK
jgi:cysteate synthase